MAIHHARECNTTTTETREMTRNRFTLQRFCLAIAIAFIGVIAIYVDTAAAQTTTGSIRGAVRSTDGGPVTDATIIARAITTGMTRNAATNSDIGRAHHRTPVT